MFQYISVVWNRKKKGHEHEYRIRNAEGRIARPSVAHASDCSYEGASLFQKNLKLPRANDERHESRNEIK